MARTLASLVVRIGADVTGVTAGLNTLDRRTRKLKKQFTSVTDSTLRWQSALGVLAGATGAAFAAAKIFELGAGVEETASKFNTVFGPAVEGAQGFLDEFATTAGLTNVQGQELLATTGAITQGLGFTQEASAGLSERIVRMAADIASFNNTQGGAERVTQAMISALNGETESLKESAKVVVLQADVMAKAAEMTGKATKEITRQDKALATLELIAERSGVAMGDLGRTMQSPANRARKLVAEVLNVRNSLAHALLPAMGVVLEEMGKAAGSEGFQGLSTKIRESSGTIAAWAQFAVETFKAVAMAIAAPVRIAFNLGEVLGKVLVAAAQAMTGNFEGARETLGSMVGDFGDMKTAITNVIAGFDNMRVASGAAWQSVSEELTPAIAQVMTPALTIANAAFREMAGTLPTVTGEVRVLASAKTALAAATNAAADAEDRLNSALGKAGGFLGGLGALGGALGFAIPGLGTAGGLLSAFRGFSGLFQHGGHIPSGGWGIVGEKGPEIVQGPAQVTPMTAGAEYHFHAGDTDPISMARDQRWLRFLRESGLNLVHHGAT